MNARSDVRTAVTGGPTSTVTTEVSIALPSPTQVSVYVVLLAGATDWLLFVLPPVLKKSPVQLSALELVQVKSDDPPSAMKVKSAVRLAITGGPTTTVRFDESVAPPAPMHVIVYLEVTEGVTNCVPPVITSAPVQAGSSSLVAEHVLAFALPQVRVLDPPRAIVSKSAVRVVVTGGPTVTVALSLPLAPPAPVHVTT
jgi:hypothetical protein